MAVLRSLSTTLGLNAAAYRSELKRASKETQSFGQTALNVGAMVTKGFGRLAKATTLVTGLSSALLGVSAYGLVSNIKKTYQALDDVVGTAHNLGVVPRRFDEMRRAAQWSGVSMSDLADSMRDLNTQITRAAQSGKGPLVEFFTKINQRAEDWAKLSPDEQLKKFADELHKLPDNQVLYWLNRVNGSLAKMKDPLMSGELANSRKEVERLGLALSTPQFDNIHQARIEFEKLGSLSSGVWEHVQAAAAPAISMVLEGISGWITKAAEARGGFRQLGQDIALFILDGVEKASEAIYQFVDDISQNIKRSQLNYGWGGVSKKDRDDYDELVGFTQQVKNARQQLIDEYQRNGNREVYEGQLNQIAKLTQLQEQLNGKMKEMLSPEQGEFYQSLTGGFKKARQAIIDAGAAHHEDKPSGSSNTPLLGAPRIIDPRKMQSAMGEFSRLRSQLEQDNVDSLQRLVIQEETARQRIIAAGQAAGASQREIAQAVAENEELYAKKRQALVEQYSPVQQMQRQYQELSTLFAEFRETDLFNEQEYQEALDKLRTDSFQKMAAQYAESQTSPSQRLLGDIDPLAAIENQYEREFALLEFYNQKKLLSEERYQQLRADKTRQKTEAISQYQNRDAMKQLHTQQQLFEGMSGLVGAFAGKSAGAYRSLFAISKGFQLAQTIMASKAAIAQAWSSAPFPANLGAVAAAVAETGVLTAAIQSVSMKGMAHDGIDNIPREGTWLLDKGERVVDKRTNADLKAYLSQKNRGVGNRVNHVVVNNHSYLTVHQAAEERQGNEMGLDAQMLLGLMEKRTDTQIRATIGDMLRDGGELSR